MNVKIIGEHLEVTEGISNHILEKFHHIPAPEKLSHIEFRVGANKTEQYVSFNARCLEKDFHFESTSTDLYSAIDLLMDKIKRNFVKFKDKNHHHVHKAMI